MSVSEEVFKEVALIVSDTSVLPIRKSSNAEKFRFYGLYKRGTVGKLLPPYSEEDVDTGSRPKSRPGMFSIEGRGKYDAWKEADKLSKQDARNEYVKLAKEIVGGPVLDAVGK